MSFDPKSETVKLCLQAMAMEEDGEVETAREVFLQAWSRAKTCLEQFLSAHHVARLQDDVSDRLRWLETALELALQADHSAVASALPLLYSGIAKCHEELGNAEEATANQERADSCARGPSDEGPFYHGTKADLRVGALLTAGGSSNYEPGLRMNHVYFTALIHGAGLAAALAKGDGSERVYVVEPTGEFEDDPNVTNQKFAGNPTRSYRSEAPLRIIDEVTDWLKQTPEELQRWREKLARSKGKIIN